jgi:acetyl-CoA C-acetyltransferase
MLRLLNDEVVILSAARTPIGAFDGILKGFKAPQLGATALKAAIERSGLKPEQVEEVILGAVVAGGLGQSPAKQAAVGAGMPMTVRSMTVNTVCSSGMAAIVEGCRAILSGTAGVAAVGGMESRSSAPYLLGPKNPRAERIPGQAKGDTFIPTCPAPDAVIDEYKKFVRTIRAAGIKEPNTFEALVCPWKAATSMKDYAVAWGTARGYQVEAINQAADESFRRAEKARAEGLFADEIVPAGEATQDEIATQELQKILRDKSDNLCSSYNAPSLADAGAALIIAEAGKAKELGAKPIAKILAFSRLDTPPDSFIEAPVAATRLIIEGLKAAGRPADFDLLEGNESFGLQIPLFAKEIPIERQNLHGGAVALRHPLGAAGARILTTLLYGLKRYNLRRGIATTCFASGGAYAVAVELAPQ